MDNEKVIHAYKGFDKDLKCRGFQYEVGKGYMQNGYIRCCENGFHACKFPFDVFNYYNPGENNRFCSVTQMGELSKNGGDSKVASKFIRIDSEIGLEGIIEAGVKLVLDKVDWKDHKKLNTAIHSVATNTDNYSVAANTGNYSFATNIGVRSVASNTGDYSQASNAGYRSAAANNGNCSAAINIGDYSTAVSMGRCSASTNAGDCSIAASTGDCSVTINTGRYSASVSTGDYSAAMNAGNGSAAINAGDNSSAKVSGRGSIAIVTGGDGQAAGALHDWIVLTERNEWNEDEGIRPIKEVKAFFVDGKNIKADTFYKLVDGEAVEA